MPDEVGQRGDEGGHIGQGSCIQDSVHAAGFRERCHDPAGAERQLRAMGGIKLHR